MRMRRAAGVVLCAIAGCHLIGGTEGLFIREIDDGAGAAGGDQPGGVGGTPSPASTTSTGGMGGSPECVMSEDCHGDPGECSAIVCIDNVCTLDPEPTESPCTVGGSYCDGAGTCVPCIVDRHCGGGVCDDYVCYSPSCDNMIKDPNESDTDCGGVCSPCDNGLLCNVSGDCKSNVCNGTCQPCMQHGLCPPDHYCGGGICLPQKPNFSPCGSGAECLEGGCCMGGCWYWSC
jgi:hypothetical protein